MLLPYYLQINRLEVLLSKCKETIKSNKERNATLTKEKQDVQDMLDTQTIEHSQTKVGLQ